MKTALTVIAVILGIIISSSRIHDLLNQGSSISKVEFFIIIFLIIIQILTIAGMMFVRKEATEKLMKASETIKEACNSMIATELQIVKIYIDDTKKDMDEVKHFVEKTLGDIKQITLETNKRIDALFVTKFNH
jgi:uncharacterized membrane protein YidH (DUF202 family)